MPASLLSRVAVLALLLAAPALAQTQDATSVFDAATEAGASDAEARSLADAVAQTLDRSAAPTQQKLTAGDAAAGDQFGLSVSISGNRALVGANGDSDAGFASGSAYVFVRSGTSWTEEAKITAPDAAAGDEFGISVSLSGDRALIGAYRDDDGGTDSGSAYVFVRSGSSWTQEAKITAPDAAPSDNFGYAISLSGDRALIGAVGNDDAGSNSGSAYVFVRSGASWAQEAKITATDAAQNDQFGTAVSLSGDRALIGASGNTDVGFNSGSAYVFVRVGAGWVQEDKLTAGDAEAGDVFGYAVSISGDRALVGAFLSDDAGAESGSAYVFVRSGAAWTQEAKLTAIDAAAGDQFGFSVAISGDRALVGSVSDDNSSPDSGSAYLFERSGATWTQESKLIASDAAQSDLFGVSVSLSGDDAFVGAYYNDDDGSQSGAAYAIDLSSGSVVATRPNKLRAGDAARDDRFGASVSLSGDRALIGAIGDRDAGVSTGSAYVFVRSGGSWTQEAKLTSNNPVFLEGFGSSVSLSNDHALIGATGNDDAGSNSGTAYVFVRSGATWTQEAKLTAADAAEGDRFGLSVSISDDRAIIGAYLDDDDGSNSGSAYVFVRSGATWTQEAKLTASDAAQFDQFGSTISLSENRALIGAVGDDDAGSNSGSAYVFVHSGATWTQEAKLTASDAAENDQFAATVSLSGDRVLIGAHRDDDAGTDSGSAYVFVRSGSSWTQEAKLAAPDAVQFSQFGNAVSISGENALVGVQFDDEGGDGSGSAYVFNLTPRLTGVISSGGGGWRMLSASVNGLTVGSLTGTNLVSGVPGDACASGIVNLFTSYAGGVAPGSIAGYIGPDAYTAPLVSGRGFFWYFFGDASAAGPCGTGATASSVQPLPVVLSASGIGPSIDVVTTFSPADRVANDDTFYLMGNPFNEGFDLEGTAAGLVSISGSDANGPVAFQNTVQIWNPVTQGYVTRTALPDGGADGEGGTSASDDLSVWQGVWLERSAAASPAYPLDITYSAAHRTGDTASGGFVGKNETSGLRSLQFEVTGTVDGQPVYDGAASVLFATGASVDWDAYDASKLGAFSSPYALVAPVGRDRDGELTQKAAESLPFELSGSVEVPISFLASGDGVFELRWNDIETIPDTWALVLTDQQTGQTTDLRTATEYTFTADATADWTDRFAVTFSESLVSTGDRLADGYFVGPTFPNPSRDQAQVSIEVAEAQQVRADVFNVLGQRVATILDGPLAPGAAVALTVDTSALAVGSYIVRVTGETFVESRRLTVVR